MSPTQQARLEGLVDMLQTGRHPDGRALGDALTARLERLKARLRRADRTVTP